MDATIAATVRRNLDQRKSYYAALDWSGVDRIAASGVRITPRHCIMVLLGVEGFTQAEIGEVFGVGQPCVNKFLREAECACRVDLELVVLLRQMIDAAQIW